MYRIVIRVHYIALGHLANVRLAQRNHLRHGCWDQRSHDLKLNSTLLKRGYLKVIRSTHVKSIRFWMERRQIRQRRCNQFAEARQKFFVGKSCFETDFDFVARLHKYLFRWQKPIYLLNINQNFFTRRHGTTAPSVPPCQQYPRVRCGSIEPADIGDARQGAAEYIGGDVCARR